MFVPKSFLLVILVTWQLPSAKLSVHVSEKSRPTETTVDLTGETPDSSGSAVWKSGEIFPPESTWFYTKGKKFGCLCDVKSLCLPLCCPMGYARNGSSCVKDNVTSAILPRVYKICNITLDNEESNEGNLETVFHDPCDSISTDFKVLKVYELLKNGSIHSPDLDHEVEFGMYCLFRDVESSNYSAKVCRRMHSMIWWFIGSNGSTLFALATLIVYSVVPELRNLHGTIFRLYLISYIVCIVMAKIGVRPVMQVNNNSTMIYVATAIYLCLTCAFWLNVMSFDIWWTLRKLQAIQGNIKERERRKMRYYMIYAWLGPGVLMIIFCSTVLIGNIRDRTITLWFLLGPIIILGLCNTCLYISTAITIMRRKKDTAQLVDGVNKHHNENEQWFNLYLKLFIIMGGPMVLLTASVLGRSRRSFGLIDMLQLVQCISVFVIFVWKKDVRRSIGKRYHEVLKKLRSFFRCNSTVVTDG